MSSERHTLRKQIEDQIAASKIAATLSVGALKGAISERF
jgi:hypothetical protein